jgi:uncharacterized membrane protein YGL010W
MARADTLVSWLSDYGAYHSTRGNKIVHAVFVPLLLWSAFASLAALVSNTAAFILWGAYVTLYIILEPVAGTTASVLYCLLLLHAQRFAASAARPLLVACAVHVASWFFQVIVGHALIEKRRPALLDSLVPSLALAPLFIVMEVAFDLGYRPALRKRVDLETQTKRQQWLSGHKGKGKD